MCFSPVLQPTSQLEDGTEEQQVQGPDRACHPQQSDPQPQTQPFMTCPLQNTAPIAAASGLHSLLASCHLHPKYSQSPPSFSSLYALPLLPPRSPKTHLSPSCGAALKAEAPAAVSPCLDVWLIGAEQGRGGREECSQVTAYALHHPPPSSRLRPGEAPSYCRLSWQSPAACVLGTQGQEGGGGWV